MPLLAVGATAGKAVGGFALSKAKQGWSWLTNQGFSLTSGKWSLRKSKELGATNELSNAVGGMSTTTLALLGLGAYLLFKK